ncbi:hypothetical protein KDX16_14590 [Burkholderia vietnamiensis]|uniref:hypothetical protein n=1 Tax=Burkholderia vietnamiensis TaxID=60552 RepID=UPI000AF4D21E|nr:hypothetical protein [Burkholderia vietnamiensis]MBR7917053.1 hypothetical protein [Burkholderia vietnamiensis]MDN8035867.1 hypothetical protein [Burkholderia vietnamiensis]
MPYCTSRTELVHLTTNGQPAVCRYRCIVTGSATPAPRVIVQIEPVDLAVSDLRNSHNARDAVINRILDRELVGVPLDLIDIVLSESAGHFAVALEVDLEDYIQRGNRYKLAPESGKRGRIYERISIESRNFVGGRVRVHTAYSEIAPASPELVALINVADAT